MHPSETIVTQVSLDLIISDVGGFIDQRQQKKLFKRKCSFDRSIFFSGMCKIMNPIMEILSLGIEIFSVSSCTLE